MVRTVVHWIGCPKEVTKEELVHWCTNGKPDSAFTVVDSECGSGWL